MFSYLERKGFKYIFPENLENIMNSKSVQNKYKKVAKYCFENANAFETVLSSISLHNLMFPHTSSSSYELGQFKNRWSGRKTTIFEPKTKMSTSGISSKVEIGEYIRISHKGEFVDYQNSINSCGYPEMNWLWLSKYVNYFSAKIKKERVDLNIRVFKKTSVIKRNNYSHYIFDTAGSVDESMIYVPSKLFYIFLCLHMKSKTISEIFDNYNDIYNEVIESIADYYLTTPDKISLMYSKSKVSLKQLILSMIIIWKMTNPRVVLPNFANPRNSRTFYSFNIGKRLVTTYAKTYNGDIKKIAHKQLAKENYERSQNGLSISSFAYKSSVNWIDNIAIHTQNIYEDTAKFFVIKMDISDFFGTISKDILFSKTNKDNWTLDAADIDTRQGLVLSPMLANLYLSDFDEKMRKYFEENDVVYTRYSDDIVLSQGKTRHQVLDGESNIINYIRFVRDELSELGLSINEAKTSVMVKTKHPSDYLNLSNYIKDDLSILGVRFNWKRAQLSKRKRDRLDAWRRNPEKYGLSSEYVKAYENALKSARVSYKKRVE